MAARAAIGKPYIWGANGPSGFDCSGLMQWSYARAGVGLPRTSQEQRYAGHQVPLSEAKPGDLVAYRHDASHIAMYVGNGQVVHAPYPGRPGALRPRRDDAHFLGDAGVTVRSAAWRVRDAVDGAVRGRAAGCALAVLLLAALSRGARRPAPRPTPPRARCSGCSTGAPPPS